jgi:hypothetical protein
MTNQYREADIITWVKSLRVREKIGVYDGDNNLMYPTQVSRITDSGEIICVPDTLFLANGMKSGGDADKTRCIKPLESSINQIGSCRVLDFSKADGLLVKYSDHMNHLTSGSRETMIGIIVATEVRFDAIGKGIAWPAIIWEGSVTPEVVHPIDVAPYRLHDFKLIDMCTVATA